MKRIGSALIVVLLACPGQSPPPGDEQMGRYTFRAEPVGGLPDACTFVEIPDGGFSFEAAFSRFRDAGLYYVTIGGVAHEATWDGQRISATYSAQRNFSQCGCAGGSTVVTTMKETISATVVSRSQSEAAGGCVDNPPLNPDAGIVPPNSTGEGGFDAVRACGTLSEEVTTDVQVPCFSQCNFCQLRYTIEGERR